VPAREPSRRPAPKAPAEPPTDLLVAAYCQGIFPMADPDSGELSWYSPEPRAIIPLDTFHVPANLARLVRSGRFEIRSDCDFEAVMRACAKPRPSDDQTWIDERLVRAYVALHEIGHAHSVEAWRDGRLVGGLYGVHVGGAFFGESMFIKPDEGGSGGSKVCLVHLVEHLRARGFILLDTQFWNPHLEQFGCEEIRRDDYLHRVEKAVALPVTWGYLRPPKVE